MKPFHQRQLGLAFNPFDQAVTTAFHKADEELVESRAFICGKQHRKHKHLPCRRFPNHPGKHFYVSGSEKLISEVDAFNIQENRERLCDERGHRWHQDDTGEFCTRCDLLLTEYGP